MKLRIKRFGSFFKDHVLISGGAGVHMPSSDSCEDSKKCLER